MGRWSPAVAPAGCLEACLPRALRHPSRHPRGDRVGDDGPGSGAVDESDGYRVMPGIEELLDRLVDGATCSAHHRQRRARRPYQARPRGLNRFFRLEPANRAARQARFGGRGRPTITGSRQATPFGRSEGVDRCLRRRRFPTPSAYLASGNHFVYSRNPAGSLRQRYWESGTGLWNPIELGGSIAGQPAALRGPDGNHCVYYRGTKWSDLAALLGQKHGWHPTPLGGSAAGDPTACVDANRKQFVYFQGSSGALWQWQWESAAKGGA
jgi:hypothetical protein